MNDDLITTLVAVGWSAMSLPTMRAMYILMVDHMDEKGDGGTRMVSTLCGVLWPIVWAIALVVGLLWGVTKLCDNWLFDATPKQKREAQMREAQRRKAQERVVVKDGHPEEVSK